MEATRERAGWTGMVRTSGAPEHPSVEALSSCIKVGHETFIGAAGCSRQVRVPRLHLLRSLRLRRGAV